MEDGSVLLFENTRYEDVVNGEYVKRESGNDPKLGEYWASLADEFINDAFGTAHRSHASNAGIAEAMHKDGKPVAAGFLMEKKSSSWVKLLTIHNVHLLPFLVVPKYQTKLV